MKRSVLVALLGACLSLLPAGARANRLGRPLVPPNLEVPSGHKPFLVGFGVGTQNYVCLPTSSTTTPFAWTPTGPQATLFGHLDEQLTTHFLSPNPDEGGTARATWQHSRDTSAVWGQAIESSTDSTFVEPGAVPWLLLRVVGSEAGPNGGRRLAEATYIQRVHTSGGVAPATGCSEAGNVGARAFVPYTTDYYFYKAR
jgi:hypothetical protein